MDAACTIQDSIHVFSLVHKYVSRILGTYHFRRGISGNFSYGIHVCVPWNKFLLFVDNFRNSYGDCIYPGMEVQQKETRRNRRIQLTLRKFPHIIKVSVL